MRSTSPRISSSLALLLVTSLIMLAASTALSWSNLVRQNRLRTDYTKRISEDNALAITLDGMEQNLDLWRRGWEEESYRSYLTQAKTLEEQVGVIRIRNDISQEAEGVLRRISWFNSYQEELLSDLRDNGHRQHLFITTAYVMLGWRNHRLEWQKIFQKDISQSSTAYAQQEEAMEQRSILFLLAFIGVTVLILFAFSIMVREMNLSIRKALTTLVRLSHHEWDVPDLTGTRFLEFQQVFAGINGMKYQLHGYVEQLCKQAQTEQALVDARLRALRAQVNPHFLFNVLHQIGVASLVESPRKVMQMVEATGKILRYSLDMGDGMVQLSAEVEVIRQYLWLQKKCHERPITVIIDIAGHEDWPIVPMTIQPLVENAIKHGFRDCEKDPFLLTISATEKEGVLWVHVTDNGIGFDQAPSTRGTGIGLGNIRSRLELLFDRTDLMQVNSKVGSQTEIVVGYPHDESSDR